MGLYAPGPKQRHLRHPAVARPAQLESRGHQLQPQSRPLDHRSLRRHSGLLSRRGESIRTHAKTTSDFPGANAGVLTKLCPTWDKVSYASFFENNTSQAEVIFA